MDVPDRRSLGECPSVSPRGVQTPHPESSGEKLRHPTVGRELPTERNFVTAVYVAIVKVLQAVRFYDIRDRRYASMVRSFAATHFHPDSLVMDLGCGPGGITARLRNGCRLLGVDADRYLLSSFVVPNLPRIQARAERLPIKDGRIGAIVAISLVEHITDQLGFFRELSRVLEPGGWIVLQVPELGFPIEPHTKWPLLGLWRPSLRSWILKATGYADLNLSTTLATVMQHAGYAGCPLRRIIPIWHFRIARLIGMPMGYFLLLQKGSG